MKPIYGFFLKKLFKVERDLRELSNSDFAKLGQRPLSYTFLGLRYFFYGSLESILKLLVLLTRGPEGSYKVLVAPYHRLNLRTEEVRLEPGYQEHAEYHKTTKQRSSFGIIAGTIGILLVSVMTAATLPGKNNNALATAYSWVQASWIGGITGNTALHPTNETGWNQYSAKTSGISAGSTVTLTSTSQLFVDDDDSTNDSSNPAGSSGGKFSNGTCASGCVNVASSGTSIGSLSHAIKLTGAFECGDNIVDSRDTDNSTYPTTQIGTQCWMAKNENVGIDVTNLSSENPTNGIIEKTCAGGRCPAYGGYYTWNEALQYGGTTQPVQPVQGICPAGWHIPSDIEWHTLEDFLWKDGGSAGVNGCGIDDATHLNVWQCTPAGSAAKGGNYTGAVNPALTGLPVGLNILIAGTTSTGINVTSSTQGRYRSSTLYDSADDYIRLFGTGSYDPPINRNTQGIGIGVSVRCLHN